jgi:hypothetical protein
MNSETPLNRFLVDLGRHQTLVLKEMIEGQLPHLMAEQSEEVKKLKEQNEMMLDALEKFTQIEYAMGKDLMLYGNTYVPEEWLQFLTIARDIISKVKGENQ